LDSVVITAWEKV